MSIKEMLLKVQSVTGRYHHAWTNKLFEGVVTPDGFCVLPTFNYHRQNQLRPEIIGEWRTENQHVEVDLKFRLPKNQKNLLGIVFFLNLVLAMIKPSFFPFSIELTLSFIVLTVVVFYLFFMFKVDKSERILKELLLLK